jgi:hypothetical protein
MVQGVRLPKDPLIGRYRVSERVAVRVGALLARGVEVTGALLDLARPGSAAETLLLLPEILAGSDRIETADLARAARGVTGGNALPPLVAIAAEGRRILALEEEVLAESAWASMAAETRVVSSIPSDFGTMTPPRGTGRADGEPREAAPSALAIPGPAALGRGPSDALRPEEAQGLFTPEAVAHIKLTILTAVEPAPKIEALRQLAFVPLEMEEKGRLCLKALADDHPGVRREAAMLLRTLGVIPEVAETIAGLSEGEPRTRRLAMGHVAALQSCVSPSEQFILLAVLLSVVREEKDAALQAAALDALAAYAPRIGGDGELLARVLRLLYPLLAADGPAAKPASDAMIALGRANPRLAGEALWREVQSVRDAVLRRRLLGILARLEAASPTAPASDHRRALADAIARELGQGTDSDPLCRQLALDLIGLGTEAAAAIMETFPSAAPEQWPFLVKTLDDVATAEGAPDSLRRPVGEFFLKTWRTGGRILRLALLSTRVPVDPALPADLRREFARAFLTDLHDAGFPHIADATETAVRRMGADVLPVVREWITTSAYAMERQAALQIFACILRDVQETAGGAGPAAGAGPPVSLPEAVTFLRGLEAGTHCPPGAAVRAVAIAISGGGGAPELVAEVAADYRRRLASAAAPEDMVCALGWLASNPQAAPTLKVELFVLVVELLVRATADAAGVETRTDEGIRIELDTESVRRADFHRELILAAQRILSSPGLPPAIRDSAVQRMLAKWAAVSNYDVIWAPRNVTDLAEALGTIAVSAGLSAPLRVAILDGLLAAARSLPVIRALGRACAGDCVDPAYGAKCREVAEKFAGMLQHADYAEPEDQEALLDALGRLADLPLLGATEEEGEPVRRRVVECLLDGFHHGYRRAREALQGLAASPRVPESLRRVILDNLGEDLRSGRH